MQINIASITQDVPFEGTLNYWESRYASGGTSGAGSYGKLAKFKAGILNAFVRRYGVLSVVELGCGDGNQLAFAEYPHYVGWDVSQTAIELCRHRFRTDPIKEFYHYDPVGFKLNSAKKGDLALSLDVIYHLTEYRIFEQYMRHLFSLGVRFIVIYSSNTDLNSSRQYPHVRHRLFSRWIQRNATNWRLFMRVPNKYPFRRDRRNGSFSDFYFYKNTTSPGNEVIS